MYKYMKLEEFLKIDALVKNSLWSYMGRNHNAGRHREWFVATNKGLYFVFE